MNPTRAAMYTGFKIRKTVDEYGSRYDRMRSQDYHDVLRNYVPLEILFKAILNLRYIYMNERGWTWGPNHDWTWFNKYHQVDQYVDTPEGNVVLLIHDMQKCFGDKSKTNEFFMTCREASAVCASNTVVAKAIQDLKECAGVDDWVSPDELEEILIKRAGG